jgi:hypothetical protein
MAYIIAQVNRNSKNIYETSKRMGLAQRLTPNKEIYSLPIIGNFTAQKTNFNFFGG